MFPLRIRLMGSRHKDDLAGYEELPEVTGRYQKERSKKTAPVVIPLLVVAVVGRPLCVHHSRPNTLCHLPLDLLPNNRLPHPLR